MRRPRITTRRMMIAVALSALVLWPVHCARQRPCYESQAVFHDMMAGFCKDEAALMRRRAHACTARGRSGIPWEDPSEEADILKCSPYPSDAARYGSWAEQAAVWERAAQRAVRAAQWHAGMPAY